MSTPENTFDLTNSDDEDFKRRAQHALSLIDKKKLRELLSGNHNRNRCLFQICGGSHKFQNCDDETTQQLKMTIENSSVEELDVVLNAAGKVQLRYAHFITGNLSYPLHGCKLTSSQMNCHQLRDRVSLCVRAKYVLHIVIALVSAVRQGKMTQAVCCFTVQCFLLERQTRGIEMASVIAIVNRWIYRRQEQQEEEASGELKL